MKKRVLLALSVIGMVFCLTGCGKTINLNDYATVEVTGYDGYATAELVFDSEKLEADCEKISFNTKSEEGEAANFLYGSVDSFLHDCFSGSFEISEEHANGSLVNGDSVTYVWELEEEAAKKVAGVTLKASDITVKVKGLEEVATFDAFAFIDVTFSGISPNGSAQIEKLSTDGNAANLSYSIDKSGGLSNGDTVTVSLNSANNTEYMIELFNAVPEVAEKQYVVEGLDAYATSLEQITEDMYNKMDAQAKDVINAYVANNWTDPADLHGIELLGNYFLTPKDPANHWGNQNYVDFVYKISALDHETGADFDYYYYVGFHDIMVLADGTVSLNLTDTTHPSGGWFSSDTFKHGDLSYVGYESLDTLFNNEVTKNIETYNYVSTVE